MGISESILDKLFPVHPEWSDTYERHWIKYGDAQIVSFANGDYTGGNIDAFMVMAWQHVPIMHHYLLELYEDCDVYCYVE